MWTYKREDSAYLRSKSKECADVVLVRGEVWAPRRGLKAWDIQHDVEAIICEVRLMSCHVSKGRFDIILCIGMLRVRQGNYVVRGTIHESLETFCKVFDGSINGDIARRLSHCD